MPRRIARRLIPKALSEILPQLGVYQTMRDQGVRKAQLARRMGWHMPQVDRLLDLHHKSQLDQAEAALTALGRRLEVRVE